MTGKSLHQPDAHIKLASWKTASQEKQQKWWRYLVCSRREGVVSSFALPADMWNHRVKDYTLSTWPLGWEWTQRLQVPWRWVSFPVKRKFLSNERKWRWTSGLRRSLGACARGSLIQALEFKKLWQRVDPDPEPGNRVGGSAWCPEQKSCIADQIEWGPWIAMAGRRSAWGAGLISGIGSPFLGSFLLQRPGPAPVC